MTISEYKVFRKVWLLNTLLILHTYVELQNKRRAKTITVSVRLDGDERWTSLSRSCSLPSYSAERITQVAISLIQHTNEAPPKDSVWLVTYYVIWNRLSHFYFLYFSSSFFLCTTHDVYLVYTWFLWLNTTFIHF